MKKIFFFIAALAVAFTANAKVTTISPDADNDALRLAVHYAEDGDIIEMTEGTYVQCNNGYVAFDGKEVTVKAAEGANVVLQLQVPITLANGGKATLENIKIDASRLTEIADWYEHVIYTNDATEGKELVMEGCELYGFNLNKSAIYSKAENKLDLCKINNCYFHDNMKSCLFFEGSSLGELEVTNSTVANIATASPYYAGVIDVRNADAKVTIDHCTFYNCLLMNTDYAAITMRGPQAANVTISNNIFMLPEAIDGHRAIRENVEATNCMTFNYVKDNGGIHSSVTKTNCQLNVDPQFVDAANGNFALAEGSPAIGAATDGSELGDTRWNAPAEEEPGVPEEPVYEVYEDEITNLSIDLENLIMTGGPSTNFQVEVVLGLGEDNGDGSFALLPESYISVMGSEATFIDGYAYNIDVYAPAAKAVVHCSWNDMLLEFQLTMSATPMEATVVVVENATVEVEKYLLFGDTYDYSLKMTGTWYNDADGLEYPVLVEVPVYYPEATEPSTILSTVTVGGWGDADPWLGFGEGELTITTVDGVVTATGVVNNPMAGIAIDITISGALPTDGPATGLDNLDTTVAPAKFIENGQLIIIRNGVKFNAAGQVVK